MFSSKVGVKQGCILIPTLFSIYLNDMVKIFDVTCDPTLIDNKRISCLKYADGVILISESANGLYQILEK
jgi:hypothetical protein